MLEIDGLEKRFGDVVALDGLDLSVAAGEIVGLVGHNGAGKTTAVAVVLGLVRPDAGAVLVGGIDALAQPRRARALTGVAAQDLQLYVTATVRQNLALCAGLAGAGSGGPSRHAARRAASRGDIERVLDEVGLGAAADRRVAVLSGGQRRRVQAACALLGSPALLLLDEPTVGADPQTRSALLAAVRRRAEAGAAVLYTTHYLPQLVELGATVAVVRAGRVVARGSQVELLAELPARVVVTLDEPSGPSGATPDALTGLMAEPEGDAWVIRTRDPGAALAGLISAGGRPRRVDVQRPSLDDLFAALDHGVRDAA